MNLIPFTIRRFIEKYSINFLYFQLITKKKRRPDCRNRRCREYYVKRHIPHLLIASHSCCVRRYRAQISRNQLCPMHESKEKRNENKCIYKLNYDYKLIRLAVHMHLMCAIQCANGRYPYRRIHSLHAVCWCWSRIDFDKCMRPLHHTPCYMPHHQFLYHRMKRKEHHKRPDMLSGNNFQEKFHSFTRAFEIRGPVTVGK